MKNVIRPIVLMVCGLLLNVQIALGQSNKPQPSDAAQRCLFTVDVWYSQLNAYPRSYTGNDISVQVLSQRRAQLTDCSLADPENAVHYLTLDSTYGTWLELRYMRFLYRHNLMDQFTKEDLVNAGEAPLSK